MLLTRHVAVRRDILADVTAALFLDANASVPPLPAAVAALQQAATLGNPSSPHARGRAARRALDIARTHIAAALGAEPREVLLTSGASEANRWLVDALCASARDAAYTHSPVEKSYRQFQSAGSQSRSSAGLKKRLISLSAASGVSLA